MKDIDIVWLKKTIRTALREDAVSRDITTRLLIPRNSLANAVLLAKQDFVLCGMPLVLEVFRQMDRRVKISSRFRDGQRIRKGDQIAALAGPTRALLSGERVALNFLQRLSGIATLTAAFVEALRGTHAKVLDTRKTTPGLRLLERYAVKTGGGVNHRFDLSSMAMAKDNHLAAVGSMEALCRRLRPLAKRMIVVVEAKTLTELQEALRGGARWVQLDNMSLGQLRRAVRLTRGRAKLEATGGMTVKRARAVARTGVDFLSVGALTHSAPAVDISLEFKI